MFLFHCLKAFIWHFLGVQSMDQFNTNLALCLGCPCLKMRHPVGCSELQAISKSHCQLILEICNLVAGCYMHSSSCLQCCFYCVGQFNTTWIFGTSCPQLNCRQGKCKYLRLRLPVKHYLLLRWLIHTKTCQVEETLGVETSCSLRPFK